MKPTLCNNITPFAASTPIAWPWPMIAALTAAAWLAGCGGDDQVVVGAPDAKVDVGTSGDSVVADSKGDSGSVDSTAADTAADSVVPPDVGPDGVDPDGVDPDGDGASACPGGVGCACAGDQDCKDGATCEDVAGAKQCVAPCQPTTPPDETCDGVDNDCDGDTDEATCADGACTTGACAQGADKSWSCKSTAKDGACDDGDGCSEGDSCANGSCQAGKPKVCDDSKPCTTDSCQAGKDGTCVHTPAAGPCDLDGNACTPDTCAEGACKPGAAKVCDDGKVCTTDACDGASGACTATNLPNGASCTDANVCTGGDSCQDGACLGKAVDCDDGNPCTADNCDKAVGCGHAPIAGVCDDGNGCTNGDTCVAGACKGGDAVVCDDKNPCTSDACDPKTGACATAPAGGSCSDGSACTKDDACKDGVCTGAAVACDDGNPCTTDSCDAATGCALTPNKAPCDDGNACTDFDLCNGGKCKGTLKEAADCDDGNPCTTDACDAKAGCTHTANNGTCDDGNACTANDACKDGACAPGVTICACTKDADCDKQNPANACLGKLYCDKASNTCKINPATVVTCDTSLDGACAQTSCDPKTATCAAVKAEDGKACDADATICTANDACKDGVCVAGAKQVCDDNNACTADSCDPKLGCQFVANTAACDADGDACTVGDTCDSKLCVAGKKKNCDDGNPCTLDGCDKQSGACKNDATAQEGKPCDADGSLCTSADACVSGTCTAGKALDCDDGNPCSDDSCDPKAGCIQAANAKPCDADGDACTVGDACVAKVCTAGAKKNCDDSDVCTKDACDTKTGVCGHGPILGCGGNCAKDADCDDKSPCTKDSCDAGSGKCGYAQQLGACDDGSACTTSDACKDGKCVGATKKCDDANPCTDDSCDAVAGCVHSSTSAPCDDGDACTTVDACKDGNCAGKPKKCDDGDDCTKDSCNPGDGTCNAKPIAGCGGYCVNAADCDDKNQCTDEACNAGKCSSVVTTKACDDGDGCSTKDVCVGGSCTGVVTVCDDSNPCTTDGCDKKTGACTFVGLPAGATCDDDSACTGGDACAEVAGKVGCVGKAKSCDDGNTCTADSCNPLDGKCVNATIVGAPCDDGQACTFGETCQSGACKASLADSVATLAGSTAGFADGTGGAAKLQTPSDLAVMPDGTFVVADTANHRLRGVNAAGVVTTLAGTGAPGLSDGKALEAQLNQPLGVDADAAGTVWVAELGNHTIRKLAKGDLTRAAGDGLGGLVEGDALKARFNQPSDVLARKGGSVLVSDRFNHRIRLLTDGKVSTWAGSVGGFLDGPAASARFNQPIGLSMAGDGSVYVADAANHRIRRVTAALQVETVAGSGTAGWLDGDAALARFNAPWGVATDAAGALWVTDRSNYRVRRLLGGKVLSVAGNGAAGATDGVAAAALFQALGGLAVEPATGGVVIADAGNHRVRRAWISLGQAFCIIGKGCVRPGMPNPQGPCQVCDSAKSASDWTALANGAACGDGDLCTSGEICTDGSCAGAPKSCDDKNDCTADACEDASGGCTHAPIVGCGGNCAKDGDCDDKNACTDDACVTGKCANVATTKPCDDGDACTWGDVCSGGTCKSGAATEVATVTGGAAGSADGKLNVATFNSLLGLALAPSGVIYVADTSNHRVRAVDPATNAVTTYAGKGAAGMADGPAAVAQFNTLTDVAVRGDGVLVVTDYGNHRLRLVAKDGATTTWTGSGAGYVDGSASVALLNAPYATALIPAGGAYVADYGNHRIRSVAPDGSITTLAGSTAGFADGKGAAAKFSGPLGVAVLATGDVVVADYSNHRVRRVTADGVVTTLAGSGIAGWVDGNAATARMYYPWAVAVDSAGRVVIADRYNHKIRALSPAGIMTTIAGGAGGFADGDGIKAARFNSPRGLAIRADGEILVADYANHRVRRVKESGAACLVGGVCYNHGLRNPAKQCEACDVAKNAKAWTALADGAVCADGAPCTLSDACAGGSCKAGADRVCDDKIACTKDSCNAKTGACVFEVIVGCGDYCENDAQCDDSNPCTTDICSKTKCDYTNNAAACNDGNVCTQGDTCADGKCGAGKATWLTLLSGIGQGAVDGAANVAKFNTPSGVAVQADGSVLVADRANHTIRLVKPDGVTTTWSGSVGGLQDGGLANARYNQPVGLDVDAKGRVVVSDIGNQRLRWIEDGQVTTLTGGTQGYVDGSLANARFSNAFGVAFAAGGVIYVADYSNQRIRKVDPAKGVVSTVAGSTAGHADGVGAAAKLNGPIGLDVGPDGTVYFTDYEGQRVRKMTPAGLVTTIAGDGAAGHTNAKGAAARFFYPRGIIVTPLGELLVADSYNHRIRRVVADGTVSDFAGSGVAGYINGDASGGRLYYPQALAAAPQGLIVIADTANQRIRTAQATASPCSIGGTCWSAGWPKVGSSCEVCNASADAKAFSAAPNGSACSDDKLCTGPDACQGGGCGGAAVVCDDKDDCTTDACDAGSGVCTFTKIIGCKGYCENATQCDDKNPCTTDTCANNVCASTFNTAVCDDGNPCTSNERCDQGKCNPGKADLVVATAAGSTAGYENGDALVAKLNTPVGLAVDATGTVYFADSGNHRIRLLNAAGKVLLLAGSGTAGFVEGAGDKAWLNQPTDVETLADGSVAVADRYNHRVRVVTAAGQTSTLAGSSATGNADGVGAAARFNEPIGVARLGDTLWVSEFGNCRIRKVAADGTVTTLAGSSCTTSADGKGAAAVFNRPLGIAVDSAGNAWVTEWSGHRIRKVAADGTTTTVAGGTAGLLDGEASSARFNSPWGIDVDATGRVWIADYGNSRVRLLHSGLVVTAAGIGAGYKDGGLADARFNVLRGIAVLSNGLLWIGDSGNHRLRTMRVTANACDIGGVCWQDGTINPAKGCELCVGATKPKAWTAVSCP